MFALKELVDITGGEGESIKADLKVAGISTDSRTIKRRELFIALRGERFDGSNFMEQAREKGAVGAIVEKRAIVAKGLRHRAGFPLIRVKDATAALGSIAKAHRDRFNIPIIAITGSNGKTTTKEMVAQILKQRFKVLKTDKNENNKVGVARTLLRLKDQDIAVIEVGTSSRGEINYHCEILRPEAAIITNVGPSHLEGLRDATGVLKEKMAMVESLGKRGIWIRNADDEMLCRVKVPEGRFRILTYGLKKKNPDFKATDIRQTRSGIEFNLRTFLEHEYSCSRKVLVTIPMLGVHNLYNGLAAIACASVFVDIETIRKALADFKGPKMRTQIFNKDGFTIINDAYNSNPLSFRWALSLLKDYPAAGKRILVCADMLELGKDSERLHYQSGQLLAEKGIDRLITFGKRAEEIARGAIDKGMDKNRVAVFKDKYKITPFLRSILSRGDAVLVKGSRGMKMEEVVNGVIDRAVSVKL